MTPVAFKAANDTLLGGPASKFGTDGDVADLACYRGDDVVISCWKLSWWERILMLFRGRVWLCVQGRNHAPVALQVRSPFR